MGEERENLNKIIINILPFFFRTVPSLELHCSTISFLLAFDTSHEANILVFGVLNAKNITFDIPDKNALDKYFRKTLIHQLI